MLRSRTTTHIPEDGLPVTPLVRDLHALAHSREGTRSHVGVEGLHTLEQLSTVRALRADGYMAPFAISVALGDALTDFDPDERASLRYLFGLAGTAAYPGQRVAKAAQRAGYSIDTFRRNRWRNGRWTKSVELRLLEELGRRLEHLARDATTPGSPSPASRFRPDDLLGTWRGSQLTANEFHRDAIADSCYLVIAAAPRHLRLSLIYVTSQAQFLSHEFLAAADGSRQLVGIYQTINSDSSVHIEPPHRGAVVFEIAEDPVTVFRGVFWNDRHNTGTLSFDDWSSVQVTTFSEAASLDYGPVYTET